MKFASTLRKSAFAVIAATTLISGFSAVQASAAGYNVYSNAKTAHFPNWDRLNIRAWPASHSQKLSHIKVGKTVFVERCIIKSGSDWCKIRKGFKYGWVNGRHLKKGPATFAYHHPWF